MDDTLPFLFSLSPTIRILTLEFELALRAVIQDREFLSLFLSLISDPSGYPLDPSWRQTMDLVGDTAEVMQYLGKCTRFNMLEELDVIQIQHDIHHSSISTLSRLPPVSAL
ncbi:hypothetical protein GSI_04844 [Ganoderma sinense ZZ0214-1]|uniref:Uncharacterized protein n=1 Tax=Ganoderma sinense ZZ0214-1 TaxID=1077348 RepID=A0A2G8SG39_9APHY|nr:hypothetical protein GSI_04844 [Ganoderma sinense ZZ0214-1]